MRLVFTARRSKFCETYYGGLPGNSEATSEIAWPIFLISSSHPPLSMSRAMACAPWRGPASRRRPAPGPGTPGDGLERSLQPIFTQSLPLCAASAGTILKLRASSECWKHRANPAVDAGRLALVDEAAAGRIRRAGANGPTCGAVRPGNGSVIQSRGCAPNTRPFFRLLGSEDHGRGFRRREVPSGASPRGPLRTPKAAIPDSSVGIDLHRPLESASMATRK